jgi:hypothetical protein
MLTISTLPGVADQPASYSMASGSQAGANSSDSDSKDSDTSSQLLMRPPGFSLYLNGILRGVLRMGSVRDTLDYNDTEVQVRAAASTRCVLAVNALASPVAEQPCFLPCCPTTNTLPLHNRATGGDHTGHQLLGALHQTGTCCVTLVCSLPVMRCSHLSCFLSLGACRSQAGGPSTRQAPSPCAAGLTWSRHVPSLAACQT